MKKRVYLSLMALLLSAITYAEKKNVTVGDLTYKIDTEKHFAIIVRAGSDTHSLNISSSITYENITYTVTAIGEYAFMGREDITSVSIPSTVKSIGTSAFAGCGLTSVIIPSSVNTIGSGAFGNCFSLGTVSLPQNAMTIESQAFSGCTSLQSISIPEGYTIRFDAFKNCTQLNSVTIPKNTNLGGSQIFSGCTGLTSVTIENETTGEFTFSGCTSLSQITFGENVKTIGKGCFARCTALTSVVVSDNVETIDDTAFQDCTNLTSLTFGSGLKTIGANIVSGCDNLSKIIIPNIATWCNVDIGLHSVLKNAKLYSDENTEIKDLVIPEGVTKINKNVFYQCKSIESVSLSNSVETIGAYTFASCSNLTSIKIGSGLREIAEDAFTSNTSKLNKVIVPDIASFCSLSILDGYFKSVKEKYLYSDENTEIKELVIPDGVTAIGEYSFCNYPNITKVTIPNSVKTIGAYAFHKCKINTVILGKGAESIATYAFYLSNTNTSDFYSLATIPPTVETTGFPSSNTTVMSKRTLHVPAESLELYQAAYGWSNFHSIVPIVEGDPGYEGPAIVINETNFPDEGFLAFLLTQSFGTDHKLTAVEQAAITTLDASGNGISDMTGIGYLTALTSLDISNNEIAGENMDQLIEALPSYENGDNRLYVLDTSKSSEKNKLTEAQAIALKAKGWTPYRYNGEDWVAYNGQCAPPTISYANSKLSFSCATEGVSYVSEIIPPSKTEGNGQEMVISTSYTVKAYATKEGYENSEVVTSVIDVMGQKGDANGDGRVTVTDIGVIVDIILGINTSSSSRKLEQQNMEPQ